MCYLGEAWCFSELIAEKFHSDANSFPFETFLSHIYFQDLWGKTIKFYRN